MNDIRLSIVICTFNREKYLRLALESLSKQTLDGNLWEVIVVDNNSSDRTAKLGNDFRDRFHNFSMVFEPRQGLSYARNTGWQAAVGEFVAYLDDDAQAAPEWAEVILHDFCNIDPKPDAVGGPIYPWYDVSPPKWFSDELETHLELGESGFLGGERQLYGFSGSNMAIRRDLLDETGGFSPEWGMVGRELGLAEETEFFYRLRESDLKLWYNSKISVTHLVAKDKMRVTYLLKRSLQSGQTRAKLTCRRLFSKAYLIELFSFLLLLKEFIVKLFRTRSGKIKLLVLYARRLFNKLGYLKPLTIK